MYRPVGTFENKVCTAIATNTAATAAEIHCP